MIHNKSIASSPVGLLDPLQMALQIILSLILTSLYVERPTKPPGAEPPTRPIPKPRHHWKVNACFDSVAEFPANCRDGRSSIPAIPLEPADNTVENAEGPKAERASGYAAGLCQCAGDGWAAGSSVVDAAAEQSGG